MMKDKPMQFEPTSAPFDMNRLIHRGFNVVLGV
jgi:uncharacterized protein YbaA (DUF1428 family)